MDEVAKAKRKKVLKPAECKKHIQERLAQNFEAIVEGFVEEAKKGSCPHVKLANELLKEAAPRKKGPAELMLERWTRGKERPRVAKPGLVRGKDGRFVVSSVQGPGPRAQGGEVPECLVVRGEQATASANTGVSPLRMT